ncbi:MAG: hypothetical protein ABI613_03830 [Gemmatimonadota bacterium]
MIALSAFVEMTVDDEPPVGVITAIPVVGKYTRIGNCTATVSWLMILSLNRSLRLTA